MRLLLITIPILLSTTECHALSASGIKPKPIRTVAIVGSGIAGLTLAHALENSFNLLSYGDGKSIHVTMYDARSSLNYNTGAGVQLTGGMSVLRKINPQVHRAVVDASLPLKRIESRTKPWFPNNGKEYESLLSIEVGEAFREARGSSTEELILDKEVMAFTILRGALQEVLMETLPKSTAERVYFKKCLTSIRGQENGVLVGFDDGSEEGPFDLVVGCDGVNSVVKEYISSGTISKSSEKQKTAIYSGIRIRYAVQDTTPAPTSNSKQEATFFQYFGNGAYALAGTYGAGKGRNPVQCAYTIYLDDEYIGPFRKRDSNRPTGRVDENVDWSEMAQGTATRRMMLEQIQESGVPDSLVRPIIEKSSRFFELGVYLHNPFSSRGWRKQIPGSGGRFCTMAGDAAHAMPPFLGQGANQAIQDSYCLAKMIFEYNAALGETDSGRDENNFEDTLRSYEKIRWEPTTNISVKSAVLGYLEAGPGLISKVRDVVFFTLGKLGIAKKVYVNAALPKVDREET